MQIGVILKIDVATPIGMNFNDNNNKPIEVAANIFLVDSSMNNLVSLI